MRVPLKRRIRHAEVDLRLLLHVIVVSLLTNLHGAIEMLRRVVVVALLRENLTELHVGAALALTVLQLIGQLEVALDEHLHLVLVHLRVHFVAADLAQVADGDGLTGHTRHLNSVTQSELVVDARLLEVTYRIVDDTEIDVGEEFAGHIGNLLVLHVELDGIVVVD